MKLSPRKLEAMSLSCFVYTYINSHLQNPYEVVIMILLVIYRPDEFIECDDPVDHVGNATASQELGYGCLKVGFYFVL